ncbi:hypothetical protein CPB84DRAFT_1849627 [Gymnopilus junonius]|uniref:Uncharacterized protein n=1 Tax=Gymnopilus junonius TaxID=109634 RepID=A0A9P5TJH6_GYMJU|nr:hypothetical protein CPB84DRAFT_1849627 [Gymnopilus junonius]
MKFNFAFSVNVLASVVAIVGASTASDVIADIVSIASGVTALNNAINEVPTTGSTAQNIMEIHSEMQALGESLGQGTADANASSEKHPSHSLNQMRERYEEAAFEVGGVVNVVKNDLNTLSVSASAFGAVVDSGMLDDWLAAVDEVKVNAAAAFASAVAAYD